MIICINLIFNGFIIQSVLIGIIEEKFTEIWIKDIEDIQRVPQIMEALNELDEVVNVDMEIMKKRILKR